MAVPLSTGTEERLVRLFSPADVAEARGLLEQDCAENLPLWSDCSSTGLERVRFAVLRISKGSIAGLVDAIVLAQTDWRDALVVAQFAYDTNAHNNWWPKER
jgi:hypothetical protein